MIPYSVGIVLGVLAAIVLTILLYVLVLPRKLDGKFQGGFWQWIHNFFHFKKLYIEEVLKFFFVLATMTCICCGVFLLLSYQNVWGFYANRKESTFATGIIMIIVGPIVLRLFYEMMMMFILLVKNVIDINNKLKAPAKEAAAPAKEAAAPVKEAAAPVVPVAPAAPAVPVAPAAVAEPEAPVVADEPESVAPVQE